ncbi:hypothetical protein Q8G39_28170, partial [Klebsiella pneumoniae]|uniref:hypothetical protein n=1 Tax=Klebsiella pneumoniae TaxID=573 RepID=UPI003013C069
KLFNPHLKCCMQTDGKAFTGNYFISEGKFSVPIISVSTLLGETTIAHEVVSSFFLCGPDP